MEGKKLEEGSNTLDLPTKRAIAEVSGSASEASKKAKVGSGELPWNDFNNEYWKMSSYDEFHEFLNRSDGFRERYNHTSDDIYYEWEVYRRKLEDFFKYREIQLFLRSDGKAKQAGELQSLSQEVVYNTQFSGQFQGKGWLLRPTPGRYTDYQRLYVADTYHYEDGELYAEYGHLYCTYASDLAFQKFFKELMSSITWDLNWSDAERIGLDASSKYKDLELNIVVFGIEQAHILKKMEQEQKEIVPLYTKLWLEIVRKERDPMEVLNEIIDSDAAASLLASRNSIKEQIWRKGRVHLPCLHFLEGVKTYIDAASKGEYLDENDIRELIQKLVDERPRLPLLFTYADYVEEKISVAMKLGLTT